MMLIFALTAARSERVYFSEAKRIAKERKGEKTVVHTVDCSRSNRHSRSYAGLRFSCVLYRSITHNPWEQKVKGRIDNRNRI